MDGNPIYNTKTKWLHIMVMVISNTTVDMVDTSVTIGYPSVSIVR